MKAQLVWIALATLAALTTGCADDQDPRLTNDDVYCLKIIRNGGTCNGYGSTATTTTTTTTTATETVTVTTTTE